MILFLLAIHKLNESLKPALDTLRVYMGNIRFGEVLPLSTRSQFYVTPA